MYVMGRRFYFADLYPGEAQTDTQDAMVAAEAARTMPHTLLTRS